MRKSLFLVIITIFLSVFASGQIEKDRKDAEFESIKIKYTLNKDGSIEYNYKKKLKVISINSFSKSFGETFIIYNPDFQSIKINENYTILPDGRKLQNPANSLNEVLPAGAKYCARYNNMIELVVSHTGLEPNATIVLDYTITSKPKFIKELMDIVYFAEYAPIKDYEVSVELPADKELFSTMYGIRLAPEITKDNDKNTYYWHLTNLNQSSIEYYKPHKAQIYPTLKFSTIKDMQQVHFMFTNQEGIKQRNIPEAQSTLNKIIDINKSKLQQALTIRDHVIDNIHTNDIDIKYFDYIIAPPSVSWATSCGNEAEKAFLLTALLNQIGIKSYTVGFAHEILHSDYIGTLSNIEHWGVKVNIGGVKHIFSPITKTKQSLENLYNGYQVYTFDPSVDHFRANYIKPLDNSIKMRCNIDMNAKGSSQNITLSASSNHIDNFNIEEDYTKAEEIIKNVKVELTNAKSKTNIISAEYAIIGDNSTKIQDGYFEILLPETTLGLNILPSLLSSTREMPLKCNKTDEIYEYTITLPVFSKPLTKSVKIDKNFSFGELHISIEAMTNGKINISRSLKITKDIITQSDYSDFRELIQIWNDPYYKKITYKNKYTNTSKR